MRSTPRAGSEEPKKRRAVGALRERREAQVEAVSFEHEASRLRRLLREESERR